SPIASYLDTSIIEEPLYVTGRIYSPLTIDGNRISYTLQVHSINEYRLPQPEKIVIQHYTQAREEKERYGQVSKRDSWAGFLRLEEPSPARNPGAFDYREYLSRQQISFVGRGVDHEWQHRPNTAWSAKLFKILDKQQERWLKQVE